MATDKKALPDRLAQMIEKSLERTRPEAVLQKLDDLGVDLIELCAHFAKGDYAALGLAPTYDRDGNPLDPIGVKDQLKAIEMLMRQAFPAIKAVEVSGVGGGPVRHELTVKDKAIEQFIRTLGPERAKALADQMSAPRTVDDEENT